MADWFLNTFSVLTDWLTDWLTEWLVLMGWHYDSLDCLTVRTSTLVFSSVGSVSLSENFFTQSHSSAQSCHSHHCTGRPGWPVSEESYSQEQCTVYGLQLTLYRVQLTVYSIQCTVHGSCLCSVCINSSLRYTWDWALPDHCQSSAPAGGEHTTHWGVGGWHCKTENLKKCISQIPLHFNKAIGEGNDSSNSNEKKKS